MAEREKGMYPLHCKRVSGDGLFSSRKTDQNISLQFWVWFFLFFFLTRVQKIYRKFHQELLVSFP